MEAAEPLAELLQEVAGLAEMVRHALLPRGQALVDAVDAGVHGAAELVEPPVHRLGRLAGAGGLGQEAVDPPGSLARAGEKHHHRSRHRGEHEDRQHDEDDAGTHRLQDSPGMDK